MKKTFNDPLFNMFEKLLEPTYVKFNSELPKTNFQKTETEYLLRFALPGLQKDQLKITTKEDMITISYENKKESEKLEFVDSFERTYRLPENVNQTNINALMENGVLEIRLPFEKKKPSERLISIV